MAWNCHEPGTQCSSMNCSHTAATTSQKAIQPGTYDIADLLSKLITASHNHGKASVTDTCNRVVNCNCNCNCSHHSH